MSPTRSLVVPWTSRAWSLFPVEAISRLQRSPAGARVGGTDADGSADARGQLVERRLDDEFAAIDDQNLVDRLRDLCEHVARDEHRPTLWAANSRRKSRSQRTPSGSSPFAGSSRTSSSGSPRSAEASPSRCRIPSEYPLTRAMGGHSSSTSRSTSSDPWSVRSDGRASVTKVVATRAAGMEVGRLEHRPDRGARAARAPRKAHRRPMRGRSSEPRARAASAAWWSFRLRSAPRSP